ncbi:hypothetical protein YC2023_104318 [Brassica napus]
MDKAQLREFLVSSLQSVTTDGQRINETSAILLKALEASNINKYLKVKCVVEASRERYKLCEASVNIGSSTMSIREESSQVIVLVEKSISAYDGYDYEEYFLKRNITAVQNMGHRLLRFPTENHTCTCKSFKCGEQLKNVTTDKTLMHFHGCDSLTILLKGVNINELKEIKCLVKSQFNILRNRLTRFNCFLATLPRFKFLRMKMCALSASDGISNYIAFVLRTKSGSPGFSLHEECFLELRTKSNYPETDYIASLSHCDKWEAKGGKSGAYFARSIHQMLIIKEIKKDEFDYFSTTVGKKYFEDLPKVCDGYGEFKFQQEHCSAVYDLKGSTNCRLAPTTTEVLLDGNFSNIMKIWPYVISPNSKMSFEVALRNDTQFLSSVQVMDYSLFIGVDQLNHELICGIIDYLGPYDWKKALESAVKTTIGCCIQPTVIDREGYKTRFLEFIQKEFHLDGK